MVSKLLPARHLIFLVPANALLLAFLVVSVFSNFSLTNLNWAITTSFCIPKMGMLVASSMAQYTFSIFAASAGLLQQV